MEPRNVRAVACGAGSAFFLAAFWVSAGWSDHYVMQYGSFIPSRGDLATKLNLLVFILPATTLAALAVADRSPGLLSAFERLQPGRHAWVWAGALAAVTLILVGVVRVVVLRGAPVTDDENVYEFQARILASGRLYLESLPAPLRPFFDNQFVVNNGKWFGLYFMGHPALLAGALRLGLDEWLGPIEAALTVALAFGIARRVFGPRTALLAGALLVVSPFYISLSASHLSQPSSTLMLTAFIFAVLRIEAAPRTAVWWAVAAVALAYGVLIRPQTAVFFALPFLARLGWRWRRGELRLRGTGPLVAGAILTLGAVVILSINHALTGSILRTGYHAYMDQGIKWLFPFGLYYTLREMARALVEVNVWLLGWPVSLAFVPFFARRGPAWPLAAVPLLALVWYGLVAVPSVVVVGPVYYGECIVPLAILSASGIEQAGTRLGERLGNVTLVRAVLAWPAVATVAAYLTFVPVQVGSLRLMADISRAPYDLVEQRQLDRSLVFVSSLPALGVPPGAWVYYHRNPKPDLSDRVLFVRDLGPQRNQDLIRYMRDRAPYAMGLRERQLLLVPIER